MTVTSIAGAPSITVRPLASTVLQSDETSVRVGKRNLWTWVFHPGDDCCFAIRCSRGMDFVDEFLGDVRPAVLVSDRYGAERGWAKTEHRGCLAHLIRDAQFAHRRRRLALAAGLPDPLQRDCKIGRRRPRLPK